MIREHTFEGLRLVSTWPCIVEAAYLLSDQHRFELLSWVYKGGVIVYPMESNDLPDLIESMKNYTETGKNEMDLADATLYWLAANTGIRDIFTVDLRDFYRNQLPDGSEFNILF